MGGTERALGNVNHNLVRCLRLSPGFSTACRFGPIFERAQPVARKRDATKGLPRAGLETGLGGREQLLGHMSVVLAIPNLTQFAGRVFKLLESPLDVRVATGLRPTPL